VNAYARNPRSNVLLWFSHRSKGIAFEISYNGVLGDSAARRIMIGNVASAVRVTAGKHMILSSGAKTCMVC
jgi:RNase P/RNase MRP subunit p30